jgi:uncharacterized membrane protein YeaQ/YmgE (transglycosylase-associated protein family)
LRVLLGVIGLLIGGWLFLSIEPSDYLYLPALVLVVGSVLAVASAFTPWLRPRRRQ